MTAAPESALTIQYSFIVGKKTEVFNGPAEADITLALPPELAATDLTVAFMQGKLKTTGPTGPLLVLLRDGAAAAMFKAHAPT
jgi:hypothetical protein